MICKGTRAVSARRQRPTDDAARCNPLRPYQSIWFFTPYDFTPDAEDQFNGFEGFMLFAL